MNAFKIQLEEPDDAFYVMDQIREKAKGRVAGTEGSGALLDTVRGGIL